MCLTITVKPLEMDRKTYEESFLHAQNVIGLEGESRPNPTQRPKHNENPCGPSFFRAGSDDSDLSNLTLPGFFICRSELNGANLVNSDFHLSTWCWNDFNDCDFSGCDFTDSDFRASQFDGCNFTNAILKGCDLRQTDFCKCDFSSADLSGAKITRDQVSNLNLTPAQVQQFAFAEDDGPQPEGG